MKKKKTGIAIVTVPILAAGTVALAASYQSDINFKPSDSGQDVQVNQVVFDGDDTETGHKKSKDGEQSHLLQKNKDDKDSEGTQKKEQADYLFENSQINSGTVGIMDNSSTEKKDTGESQTGEAKPSSIYNVTKDPSKADTTLNNSQTGTNTSGGDNSGSTADDSGKKNNTENPDPTKKPSNNGNGGNNGGGNSGNNGNSGGGNNGDNSGDNGSDDNGKNDDNGNNNTTRPADRVQDPESEKENPVIGDTQKPFDEGIKPGKKEDENGDNASVIIMQAMYGSNLLYEGQKVTQKEIYNALDTWVGGGDGTTYIWGANAFENYVRIDAVSFDGGTTWIREFPVTIPENIGEDQMVIQASYRLSKKNTKWITRKVPYIPAQNRIFLLSEKLREDSEKIKTDTIINGDQHPEVGSILRLYQYQWRLFGDNYMTGLFPGWTEKDRIVPWFYKAQKGRHILEPADLIPLGDGYKVKLTVQWMSDTGEVGSEYNNLAYLQTLTGFTEEALSKKGQQTVMSVPKYVQAIQIDSDAELEADYLEIPDTVLYYDTDSKGLSVNQGYRVDEANTVYAATKEGILTDKEQTAYLGIPCKIKTLTIPETINTVALTANNKLSTLYIQAKILDEIPDITYGYLSNCNTVVADDLLNTFVEKNYEALKGRGNTVAATENPKITYTVKNEGIISNKGELRRVFQTGRHNFRVPEGTRAIQNGAFAEVSDLTTVILPQNGEDIELEEGCFKDSEITTIRCYSEEQFESVTGQIGKSGAPDGVRIEYIGQSAEGIGYVRSEKDGIEEITVIDAPDTLTSFEGLLTTDAGDTLTVTAIGDDAFENCSNLVWVELPESVKSIGYQAFRNCSSLQGIFINSKDHIYIGDKSLDGCDSLRIAGSNAMTAELQNNYIVPVTDEFGNGSFFIPTGSVGYTSNCIYFTEESGVHGYSIENIGGNGKMLYGLDANGNPWIGIRSTEHVSDEVILPTTTKELYTSAMENTVSPSGSYTVNWDDLTQLWVVGDCSFMNSEVSGDVRLIGQAEGFASYYIGEQAFYGCCDISSVSVIQESFNLYANAFSYCTSLKDVELYGASYSSMYSRAFTGCSELTDITFNSSEPILPVIYGAQELQFNGDWTVQEEAQHLRLHVPSGSEMAYIKAWRYLYCGYYARSGDETAYTRMWNDIQTDNINWETWELPSDETVMGLLEEKLLDGENRLRMMLGAETVSEPTDLYHYTYSSWVLTLLRVPSGVTELDLADTDAMGMPSLAVVDYIESNAFIRADGLKYLNIPFTLQGIYENAFAGITSEKVILNFESPTAPQLIDIGGDSVFNFGIDDAQIRIQVPEGCEENYIDAWKYALAGYADLDAVREAAIENLGTSEDGAAPTDEEIDLEVQRILLPAENRLRGMMGMELLDEAELEAKIQALKENKEKTQESQDTDQSVDQTPGENGETVDPDTAEEPADSEQGDNADQEENPDTDNTDEEQPENPEENGEDENGNDGEDASEDTAQDTQDQTTAETSAESKEGTQE